MNSQELENLYDVCVENSMALTYCPLGQKEYCNALMTLDETFRKRLAEAFDGDAVKAFEAIFKKWCAQDRECFNAGWKIPYELQENVLHAVIYIAAEFVMHYSRGYPWYSDDNLSKCYAFLDEHVKGEGRSDDMIQCMIADIEKNSSE